MKIAFDVDVLAKQMDILYRGVSLVWSDGGTETVCSCKLETDDPDRRRYGSEGYQYRAFG